MIKVKRIIIFGNSGSGKSTLAKELSNLTNLPYNEIDSIRWSQNWIRLSQAEFEEELQSIAATENWIVDDGSQITLEHFKNDADIIIWLKVNVFICLLRLIKRSFLRWTGNDTKAPEPVIMALRHWKHCLKYKLLKKEQLFENILMEVNDKVVVINNKRDKKNLINHLTRKKWEN